MLQSPVTVILALTSFMSSHVSQAFVSMVRRNQCGLFSFQRGTITTRTLSIRHFSEKPSPSPLSSTLDTGGLRRLPIIKSPEELSSRALKVKRTIHANGEIHNAKLRAQKHGAETLTAVSQALCLPLRDVVKGYKTELRRLHPFEKVVADLTVRASQKQKGSTLLAILDDIHEARKEILNSSKDWIAYIKNTNNARDAAAAMEEGCEKLVELFRSLAAPSVLEILEIQKSLRSAPAVRLDTPAVVLVGAPNVGKSSIVRAITSATPEVNNYPFTTRGMTLGHVEVVWSEDNSVVNAAVTQEERRTNGQTIDIAKGRYTFSQLCQVMDSPGLLLRPDEERNEMESLTLAAMQHLPTAVMYVMDLSGEAGDKCSSVHDQLLLRKDMRNRFPRRPWIDVVSKYDLGAREGALEELEEILDGAPYIKLSIQQGIGIDELKTEVLRMLGEVRLVLDAMAIVDVRSSRPL